MIISLRGRVWLGTLAVGAIYAGSIQLVDALVFSPRVDLAEQSLALSFVAFQLLAIAAFVAGLFARKWIGSRRERRSRKIQREVQEALALHSIGMDQLPQLRSLFLRSRFDVEAAISASLSTLLGDSRERVRAAAAALGVAHAEEWELLDALFAEALTAPLRRRAVLVEELEGHASELAADQIPRVLVSGDRASMIGALDMLRAWKRMVTVPNIELAVRHPDAGVRARALQAWPYVANAPHAAVGKALHDSEPEVRAAAAAAAGRLRLGELAGALVHGLSDPAPAVALAASFALAALPGGVEHLQHVVSSANRPAAAVAFEALEKATLGRMELT